MSDYALVQSNAIVRLGLPTSARRLDNGAWVLGLPDAPDDLKAACGYLPVAEVAPPPVSDAEIAERSVGVVTGKPTEVWTVRPKTADELNPPLTPDAKLDIVKAKLAELQALTAPVLAADVVDILAEIQEAI